MAAAPSDGHHRQVPKSTAGQSVPVVGDIARPTVYEPGRRLAGDDRQRPWVDWVLYSVFVFEPTGQLQLFAACYVASALVYRDIDGWFFRYDWARFDWRHRPGKLRLDEATLARARACWRPGWPLLPSQEGLL